MSEVTALLSSRVIAARRPVAALYQVSRALSDLATGARAHVTGFDGQLAPETARRLFDLGFVPGAEVTVQRRAPLRDPIVFRVADYDIALRRAQARGIRVTEVS